jgi:hypothetical protein
MKWDKICANAGLVFVTTLGVTGFNGNIDAFFISFVNALIVGAIAFFTELNIEIDEKKYPIAAFQKHVNKLLIV